jgi:nucleoside-triphosphatase THEP1
MSDCAWVGLVAHHVTHERRRVGFRYGSFKRPEEAALALQRTLNEKGINAYVVDATTDISKYKDVKGMEEG